MTRFLELLETGLLIILGPFMLVGMIVSIPATIFVIVWQLLH